MSPAIYKYSRKGSRGKKWKKIFRESLHIWFNLLIMAKCTCSICLLYRCRNLFPKEWTNNLILVKLFLQHVIVYSPSIVVSVLSTNYNGWKSSRQTIRSQNKDERVNQCRQQNDMKTSSYCVCKFRWVGVAHLSFWDQSWQRESWELFIGQYLQEEISVLVAVVHTFSWERPQSRYYDRFDWCYCGNATLCISKSMYWICPHQNSPGLRAF